MNPFCQTHDVRNLFVVDGSFMPTSGGVPSTLTILANSFRTAAYIQEQARHGALALFTLLLSLPGQRGPREYLREILWPEDEPAASARI